MKNNIAFLRGLFMVMMIFIISHEVYSQKEISLDSISIIPGELDSISSASTLTSTSIMTILSLTIPTTFNYYVSKDGSDSNAGTEAAPFATIQKAINTSVTGNAIKVKAGTYFENIDFIGKSIKVVGSPDNPELTIIDGRGITHVVQMIARENTTTLLSGFTLTNGNATSTATYNSSKGGGVYLFDNANPTLAQLIIKNNIASTGGGIAILNNSSPTIQNVLINDNTATTGGASYIYNGVSPKFYNVTITGNTTTATGYGDLYLSRGANVTVRNSIVWSTESAYEISFNPGTTYNSACTITFNYSDKRGGQTGFVNFGTSGYTMTVAWGTGNLSSDPNLLNNTGNDFRLGKTSPCIDAGDPSSSYYDVNFPPSQGNTRNDMGLTGGPSTWVTGNIVLGASDGYNSIQILSPLIEIKDNTSLLNSLEDDVDNTIEYYDGLGRIEQSILVEASPNKKDIIQPFVYDEFGREKYKYLPYTYSAFGEFRANALTEQSAFYTSQENVAHDPVPSAEIYFDDSPLNRIFEKGAPGSPWQIVKSNNISTRTGKTLRYEYGTNNANQVLRWICDEVNRKPKALAGNKYYPANTLYRIKIYDENAPNTTGNTNWTEEYKDKRGNVILKLVYDGTYVRSTTYVYDDLGLLRYVLPPSTELTWDGSLNIIVANLNKWCFIYKFDARKRLVQKKLPGADSVLMVYDKRDRLVLTQDGVQRNSNAWLFTKYDILNRPIVTGKVISSNSRVVLQNAFNNWGDLYEMKLTSGTVGYTLYNTSTSELPDISEYDVLTITYYDDYSHLLLNNFENMSFDTNKDIDTYTGSASGYRVKVSNLVTGSKVKILDGNEHTSSGKWLSSSSYYDDKDRVIQSKSHLYDGNTTPGIGTISSRYHFNGSLERIQEMQTFNNIATTVNKYYSYDHSGRPTVIEEKITGDIKGKVKVAEFRYNELGQLIDNKIGNNLQSVDYTYNIRGWLKSINNSDNLANDGSSDSHADLFAMKLLYQDVESGLSNNAQYNGNISGIVWRHSGDSYKKGYKFNYDNINRLLDSDYKINSSGPWINNTDFEERGITYEGNGNITTLSRSGNAGSILNNFAYHYEGNQLSYITDGTTDYFYTYDDNGNMVTDGRKGFTVEYNVLNLPKKILKNSHDLNYIYSAAGIKLAKKNGVTPVQYYAGDMVYNSNKVLDYIISSEGMIKNVSGVYVYEYYLKDHLGNTRVTFHGDASNNPVIDQHTDYYAFGKSFENNNLGINKYLYNGKEMQDDLVDGTMIDWYDYKYRYYDPQICRFNSIDRLASDYPYKSPYDYAENRPVSGIDLDGLEYVNANYAFWAASNPLGAVADGFRQVFQTWASLFSVDASATGTTQTTTTVSGSSGMISSSLITENKVTFSFTPQKWFNYTGSNIVPSAVSRTTTQTTKTEQKFTTNVLVAGTAVNISVASSQDTKGTQKTTLECGLGLTNKSSTASATAYGQVVTTTPSNGNSTTSVKLGAKLLVPVGTETTTTTTTTTTTNTTAEGVKLELEKTIIGN